MEPLDMLHHVDHTQLKAVASWEDIQKLCQEAVEFQTASVCIPACYVKRVHEAWGERVKICTVVGFPLGYSTTAGKLAEARQAVADGALEIDMVVNLCDVKNGDFEKVEEEIRQLKHAIGDRILKVIVEACYLTEEEKVSLCHIVTRAGADYIKTSTGFGAGGATLKDVRLFAGQIGEGVKIKAAGGIRSLEEIEAFLEAGASRIGASSAVGLAKERDTAFQ